MDFFDIHNFTYPVLHHNKYCANKKKERFTTRIQQTVSKKHNPNNINLDHKFLFLQKLLFQKFKNMQIFE